MGAKEAGFLTVWGRGVKSFAIGFDDFVRFISREMGNDKRI